MPIILLIVALALGVGSWLYARPRDRVGLRVLVLPVLTLATLAAAGVIWMTADAPAPPPQAVPPKSTPAVVPKSSPPPETNLPDAQQRSRTMRAIALARRKEAERRARVHARKVRTLRGRIKGHARAINRARREMGKKPLTSWRKAVRTTDIPTLRQRAKRWKEKRETAKDNLKKWRAEHAAPAAPVYQPPSGGQSTGSPTTGSGGSSGGGTSSPSPGGTQAPKNRDGGTIGPDPAPIPPPPPDPDPAPTPKPKPKDGTPDLVGNHG